MPGNSDKTLAKEQGGKPTTKPLLNGVSPHYTTPGFCLWGGMLTIFIHQKMALV